MFELLTFALTKPKQTTLWYTFKWLYLMSCKVAFSVDVILELQLVTILESFSLTSHFFNILRDQVSIKTLT